TYGRCGRKCRPRAHTPFRGDPGGGKMSIAAARLALPAGQTRLANQRTHSLLVARWRLIFLLLGLLFVGAVMILRIAWLGVVQPGPSQMTMAEALLPARGEITD